MDGLDSCCSWWSPRTWQPIWCLPLVMVEALASSPGVSTGASPRAMNRQLEAIQYICQSYSDLATEVLSQVNEVVTMEIRAVSHFFSNSEARFVASPFWIFGIFPIVSELLQAMRRLGCPICSSWWTWIRCRSTALGMGCLDLFATWVSSLLLGGHDLAHFFI